MPTVEIVSDVENPLLSRRELVCNFPGLGGRMNKIEAIEAVTDEFGLAGKLVLATSLKNQVGRTNAVGAFLVYDDESLARSHLRPAVFTRLEKAREKRGGGDDADGGARAASDGAAAAAAEAG